MAFLRAFWGDRLHHMGFTEVGLQLQLCDMRRHAIEVVKDEGAVRVSRQRRRRSTGQCVRVSVLG